MSVPMNVRRVEKPDIGHLGGMALLRALVVGLGGVLEPTSVLDGNSLAGLGLRASAHLVILNGDTHFD